MVVCERMSSSYPRRLTTMLGAFALIAALWATSAHASATAVIQACNNDESLSGFSKADLQSALGQVPADIDDYHHCTQRINAALIDKAVDKVPGGGKGVKGTRAKLRVASVDDLTTPAERKRALKEAAKSTPIDPSDPLSSSTDPAITTAAGNTLASTSAPGTPVALVIGLLGLVLLLGIDLAGRMGWVPRWTKILPGSRDGD